MRSSNGFSRCRPGGRRAAPAALLAARTPKACREGQIRSVRRRRRPRPRVGGAAGQGHIRQARLYPATVRFANANSKVNSDFKADVRALSFSVDLTRGGSDSEAGIQRQDFSLQNTTVLPLNDAPCVSRDDEFLTASNPAKGFALSFRDQLRVLRVLALVEVSVATKSEALSAASLLEQRSLSARRDGLRQAVGLAVSEQPCTPFGAKQFGRPAG